MLLQKLIIGSLLLCLCLCLGAQCIDGIDNDGDGLIDHFDTDECVCEENSDFYYGLCEVPCQASPSIEDLSISEIWRSPSAISVDTRATPMVGDMDGDGETEIIIREAGINVDRLYILDGSGNHEYTINTVGNSSNMPQNVCIADLNADGFSEVIYLTRDDSLRFFEYNGSDFSPSPNFAPIKVLNGWENFGTAHSAHPGVADFNQDGLPEVYIADEIIDPFNQLRLKGGAAAAQFSLRYFASVAADVIPAENCNTCDGLELIAGNTVYSVRIDPANPANSDMFIRKQVEENTRYRDGLVSVADLNADGHLDAVVSGTILIDEVKYNGVYLWDIENNSILGEVILNEQVTIPQVSRVCIGDFNGNGRMNIGFTYVFNIEFWEFDPITGSLYQIFGEPTSDNSGFTTLTQFDFNGDGFNEILYRDEESLRIWGYTPGSAQPMVVANVPCRSETIMEYPIVVDVNNDGASEVICACGSLGDLLAGQLVAWSSGGTFDWQPARAVWNQHAYFNTHINDDLTVSAEQQNHALVAPCLNNFLVQSAIYGENCQQLANPAPNAIIEIITPDLATCVGTPTSIQIEILNNGNAPLPVNTPIAIYGENPIGDGPSRLSGGSQTDQSIEIGETLTQNLTIVPEVSGVYFVAVNDTGNQVLPQNLDLYFPTSDILECNYADNLDSILINAELPPSINLGDTLEICEGNEITLDASHPEVFAYLWQDGMTTAPTFDASVEGDYEVELSVDCGITYANAYLRTLPLPEVELGNDTVICEGAQVLLDASYSGASHLWNDGSADSLRLISEAANYTVEVSNGCGTAVDAIEIEHKVCDVADICNTTPTAFSPNQDGVNDWFKPVICSEVIDFQLRVFDRWGQLVFESQSVDQGWDGYFRKSPCEIGVYAYVIQITNPLGESGIKTGNVTLIR